MEEIEERYDQWKKLQKNTYDIWNPTENVASQPGQSSGSQSWHDDAKHMPRAKPPALAPTCKTPPPVIGKPLQRLLVGKANMPATVETIPVAKSKGTWSSASNASRGTASSLGPSPAQSPARSPAQTPPTTPRQQPKQPPAAQGKASGKSDLTKRRWEMHDDYEIGDKWWDNKSKIFWVITEVPKFDQDTGAESTQMVWIKE